MKGSLLLNCFLATNRCEHFRLRVSKSIKIHTVSLVFGTTDSHLLEISKCLVLKLERVRLSIKIVLLLIENLFRPILAKRASTVRFLSCAQISYFSFQHFHKSLSN